MAVSSKRPHRSAAGFSQRHGCVTVLKGHRCITAFLTDGYVNTTGNPGMAKGGSGDVLSGIIAALICQMPPAEAVPSAVWLHGRAGDISAERYGEYSMTPSDIIEACPKHSKRLNKEVPPIEASVNACTNDNAFRGGMPGGGSSDREKMLEIRAKYIGAAAFDATAEITADYGDRVYEYKLAYSGNGTAGELPVFEPLNIKGLVVRIDGNDIVLKYDGVILDTGAFSSGGVSPVEAFPLMISAWQNGYIAGNYTEKFGETECVVAEIDLTKADQQDKVLHKVWFDKDTCLPVQGEIAVNGYTVIKCRFEKAELR